MNFVNAEEAKKLIAVEGYSILDVRDKSQFERAHIKSCYHVPLFTENQDNDLGMQNSPPCLIWIFLSSFLTCFLLDSDIWYQNSLLFLRKHQNSYLCTYFLFIQTIPLPYNFNSAFYLIMHLNFISKI